VERCNYNTRNYIMKATYINFISKTLRVISTIIVIVAIVGFYLCFAWSCTSTYYTAGKVAIVKEKKQPYKGECVYKLETMHSKISVYTLDFTEYAQVNDTVKLAYNSFGKLVMIKTK